MASERDSTPTDGLDGWYGRRRERERIESWLADPSPATEIWTFSGVAGIGKSTLLRAIECLAVQRSSRSVFIDGQRVPVTPEHVLASLQQSWSRDQRDLGLNPSESVFDCIRGAARQKHVILCVDHFESLSILEEWFHQVVVGSLPEQGVLVCVGSRTELSLEWQHDRRRADWYHSTTLRGFTWQECQQLLRQHGIDDPTLAHVVYRDTGGLPLGVDLCVRYLRDHPTQTETRMSRIVYKVSSRLLRDVTALDLHPFLDALALVHRADQNLLSAVTGSTCSTPQYHGLSELSFVGAASSGLSIHETARAILVSDFRRRNPTVFYQYHRRATEEILRLHRQSYGPAKYEYGLQLLSLCADICAAFAYPGSTTTATWQALPEVGKLDPSEICKITEIFAAKQGHPGHSGSAYNALATFIGDAAQYFPEMVRVVRSQDGEPVGFSISLALSAETLDILPDREKRAVMTTLGKEYHQSDPKAKARLMAAGWIVSDHPSLPAPVLWTALFIDWLLTLGEGTLGLAFGYEHQTGSYFNQLGFDRRGRRSAAASPEEEVSVFALDFRDQGLEDWVYYVLQHSYPFHVYRRKAAISVDNVREALKFLARPERMEGSELAAMNQWDGEFLVATLRGMIRGTLATDLTPEQQRLLQVTYTEGTGHYTFALDTLHMSRSTYYRHLEDAVERLVSALTRMPSGESASR